MTKSETPHLSLERRPVLNKRVGASRTGGIEKVYSNPGKLFESGGVERWQASRVGTGAVIPKRSEHAPSAYVYLQLRNLAIRYRFCPGQQLQTAQIADRFGVSQTPVREALRQLFAENLVDFEQGKGFFAKTLDAAEVEHLAGACYMIVTAALYRSLEGAAGSRFAEFARCLEPLQSFDARANPALSYAVLLANFNKWVVQFTRNPPLSEIIANLEDRRYFIRSLFYEDPENIDISQNLLLEAQEFLLNEQLGRSIEVMRRHFSFEARTILDLVPAGLARSYRNAREDSMSNDEHK